MNCLVCSAQTGRIYRPKCLHDICKSCLSQMEEATQKKSTCFLCHQNVDSLEVIPPIRQGNTLSMKKKDVSLRKRVGKSRAKVKEIRGNFDNNLDNDFDLNMNGKKLKIEEI